MQLTSHKNATQFLQKPQACRKNVYANSMFTTMPSCTGDAIDSMNVS
jgi:hypothetical protein